MPPKLAKKIFVHLPVSNIEASTRFYTAIGASKNFLFSDEETSCMAFSSFINVMIMGHDRFKSLCPDVTLVGDSTVIKEVLLCLSADSKEEVDNIVERGAKAGGKKDPTRFPSNAGMYGRSVEDLDGHIIQLAYMDMEV